jgi:hypothetical protein
MPPWSVSWHGALAGRLVDRGAGRHLTPKPGCPPRREVAHFILPQGNYLEVRPLSETHCKLQTGRPWLAAE